MDSFMYQTVGHKVVPLIAECLGLPLFQEEIRGQPTHTEMQYSACTEDEVEDLYRLLHRVKVAARHLDSFRFPKSLS